ncbi:hypothetical protein FISHEDRAFT_70982 [Fistulina hepatica ATCC 64428]|uniref:Endoplasmic reticulum protein n=1 Tax=Fistulina hepatica ATCC 64428 TaxID=1128425 RepID=A0A0D7AHJ9_9AGAR|nr:hypothetical protein FISHEDRAFT_70982 [Fistulina hepatica ATCC 64428]
MATTQHYIWASGHFVLLLSAFRYLVARLLFRSVSDWWYKAAFFGALVSYAIVCQKGLNFAPNVAFIKRALMDENFQYFVVALMWWTSKPVMIALIPYMIFSVFHALSFTRTTILPQVLAQGPPATAGGPPTPHPLQRQLQTWVKNNYDGAMRIVAYAEILIAVRVLIGVVTFQTSLFSGFIYGHFLRSRYFQSAFTRDALAHADRTIANFLNRPQIPPAVGSVYDTIRAQIIRWGGATQVPGVPPTQGR